MPEPVPQPPLPTTAEKLFGAELRHWRMTREMTVVDLARACDRDRRTISSAEAGRDVPSELVVGRLDDLLGTGGLLLSRYDAVVAEKRRRRLNRGALSRAISPEVDPRDASTFISETVPDGTLVTPGERFEKSWTIRNTGEIGWRGRFLSRVGVASGVGLITTPAMTAIDETPPGATVTITVPCVAHHVAGTSAAVFKMTDAAGRLYFPNRYYPGLQVQVTVL